MPAGYSPEGAICQRGLLKHSVCRLEDFPTLQGLLEGGWHGVTEVRKSQTPNFKANSIWKLQLFCEGTELEPGIGVVSAVTALVLFIPKGKCGKYHNPTFPTQNNSVTKTILAIILNVHSDTTVLPGERFTYQKAGVVRGLVKKHSLIFHN